MLVVTSIVLLIAVVLALVVGSEEIQLQRQARQVSKKMY